MPDAIRQQRSFLNAVEAALAEEDEGYARYRRTGQRVHDNAAYRAAPLEYDESGFPLPQHRPGFAKRVARLLGT